MKVIIRDAAFADLQGISAWIAKDNPRAARSVVERILDARSGLEERGPLRSEAAMVGGERIELPTSSV
jgi:plasmid stabilization system protein ParE